MKAQDGLNDNNAPNHTAYATLPISEVKLRAFEMTDCARVDDTHFSNYHDAHEFYYGIFNDRLFRFMKRHNLFQQFTTEDAEGKR